MAVCRAALGRDGQEGDTPAWNLLNGFLTLRLGRVEAVLADRDWLAGAFSVADILMADIFRVIDRFDGLATYPACHDYLTRATDLCESPCRPDGPFRRG